MLQPLAPMVMEPSPHEPNTIVAHCELSTLPVTHGVDFIVSHISPMPVAKLATLIQCT